MRCRPGSFGAVVTAVRATVDRRLELCDYADLAKPSQPVAPFILSLACPPSGLFNAILAAPSGANELPPTGRRSA